MSRTFFRQQLMSGMPENNQERTFVPPVSSIPNGCLSSSLPKSYPQVNSNVFSALPVQFSVAVSQNGVIPLGSITQSHENNTLNAGMGSLSNTHINPSSCGVNYPTSTNDYLLALTKLNRTPHQNASFPAASCQDFVNDALFNQAVGYAEMQNNIEMQASLNNNYTMSQNNLHAPQNTVLHQNNYNILNAHQNLLDKNIVNQLLLEQLMQQNPQPFDMNAQTRFINQMLPGKTDVMELNKPALTQRTSYSSYGSMPNYHNKWGMEQTQFEVKMENDFEPQQHHEPSSAPSLSHSLMVAQRSAFQSRSQDALPDGQGGYNNCSATYQASPPIKSNVTPSRISTPRSIRSFDYNVHQEDDNKTALKKVFHNIVERRRRDNINDCLAVLNDIVPFYNGHPLYEASSLEDFSLGSMGRTAYNSPANSSSNADASSFTYPNSRNSPTNHTNIKRNKGVILRDTIEYVRLFQKNLEEQKQYTESLKEILRSHNIAFPDNADLSTTGEMLDYDRQGQG